MHDIVRGLATEVVLSPDTDPIPRGCAVNLDSVESVSVGGLVDRLGRLGGDRMLDVCRALEVPSHVSVDRVAGCRILRRLGRCSQRPRPPSRGPWCVALNQCG
jgi:mRNA interferase MazF